MNATPRLVIRNFAQIQEVSIELGDLTVLVGAQGTGKSLALQWLKVAMDGREVIKALRDAGQKGKSDREIVDLVFGAGIGDAWYDESEVFFMGAKVTPRSLAKRGKDTGSVFYIPAHRSMLISDGWAAPFQKLPVDTPVVARLFSQNLFDLFSKKAGDKLFPVERKLKREFRTLIDQSIFHGGSIALEQDAQHTIRLKMSYEGARLPFMTWTAGQREFTPLLFGLYHLLPPAKIRKRKDINWVIIEEPEMGLHPEAITAFLVLVLDLLWRGYRVVLSSHSPHILTAIWMLQRLKHHRARWQLLCQAFNLPTNSKPVQVVAETALEKSYKVTSSATPCQSARG